MRASIWPPWTMVVHFDQIVEADHAPAEPEGTRWHRHRGFEAVTAGRRSGIEGVRARRAIGWGVSRESWRDHGAIHAGRN